MWLLLIEDEARLASSLKKGLEEEGYQVDHTPSGREGEEMATLNAYDILIVDWRLPDQDGKSLIEHLRLKGRTYPIIMLTALGDVDHRVAGLNAGADDYLAKPFKFEELLARLRALLRRPPLASQVHLLHMGDLELDTHRHTARLCDNVLDLRAKEFALLADFLRHPDEVLARTVIAERVWGDPFYTSDNVIDVTISNLRLKLTDAQLVQASCNVPRIETVRGVGYYITSVITPRPS